MISWLAVAAFGVSRFVSNLFFAAGIDWKEAAESEVLYPACLAHEPNCKG